VRSKKKKGSSLHHKIPPFYHSRTNNGISFTTRRTVVKESRAGTRGWRSSSWAHARTETTCAARRSTVVKHHSTFLLLRYEQLYKAVIRSVRRCRAGGRPSWAWDSELRAQQEGCEEVLPCPSAGPARGCDSRDRSHARLLRSATRTPGARHPGAATAARALTSARCWTRSVSARTSTGSAREHWVPRDAGTSFVLHTPKGCINAAAVDARASDRLVPLGLPLCFLSLTQNYRFRPDTVDFFGANVPTERNFELHPLRSLTDVCSTPFSFTGMFLQSLVCLLIGCAQRQPGWFACWLRRLYRMCLYLALLTRCSQSTTLT
jgi:hypothetical protein